MRRYKVHEVIELLLADGWYLAGQKGSHRQYKHPVKKGRVTVNEYGNKQVGNNIGMHMGKILINVDYTDNFAAAPANEDIACVSTGKTFDELKKNMEEGLRWHIDSMRTDGETVPAEFDGEWDLEWCFSVRALLHYTEGLVPKSAIARVTGINQQQLTHYASGYRVPRPAMRAKIIEGIHTIARQLNAIL